MIWDLCKDLTFTCDLQYNDPFPPLVAVYLLDRYVGGINILMELWQESKYESKCCPAALTNCDSLSNVNRRNKVTMLSHSVGQNSVLLIMSPSIVLKVEPG